MFSSRHIGPNEIEIKKMLKSLGVSSIKELIYETIPNNTSTGNVIPGPDDCPPPDNPNYPKSRTSRKPT